MQTQTMQPLPRYHGALYNSNYIGIHARYSINSEANGSMRLAHSGFRNSSSRTYFRQPPNLPTAARRNRKCTECDTTAFTRNRMSAESAHLSIFGAETEAEIRSTSILNGTSAQLGYTVPFMLVQAGKYRTEDKLKTQTLQKLKTTQKNQTTQNTAKQNYPGSVASYDTWPGNNVGLFYNAPEPTRDDRQTSNCCRLCLDTTTVCQTKDEYGSDSCGLVAQTLAVEKYHNQQYCCTSYSANLWTYHARHCIKLLSAQKYDMWLSHSSVDNSSLLAFPSSVFFSGTHH